MLSFKLLTFVFWFSPFAFYFMLWGEGLPSRGVARDLLPSRGVARDLLPSRGAFCPWFAPFEGRFLPVICSPLPSLRQAQGKYWERSAVRAKGGVWVLRYCVFSLPDSFFFVIPSRESLTCKHLQTLDSEQSSEWQEEKTFLDDYKSPLAAEASSN